ncbi:MAG: RluA family pseudouridine synthase [Spirochaetales bacterium]|nr:RluA family pseudouridine synthase [Spirochaetales bacterium]
MEIPQILYEDNHLLVVNKPTGLLVQGDKTGDSCLLDVMKAHIKKRDNKPGQVFLGLPHRLDRPTSGVVVLAKTTKALSRLSAAFRDRTVDKVYWAVVGAPLPEMEGELVHWLRKDGRTNTSRSVKAEAPGAKKARLRYKVLHASERYYLVEILLLTGRHHQIRAQLSASGCPIKGDLKYGFKRSDPGGGIHLHARSLAFPHPTKKEKICVEAPVPSSGVWGIFPC